MISNEGAKTLAKIVRETVEENIISLSEQYDNEGFYAVNDFVYFMLRKAEVNFDISEFMRECGLDPFGLEQDNE